MRVKGVLMTAREGRRDTELLIYHIPLPTYFVMWRIHPKKAHMEYDQMDQAGATVLSIWLLADCF